MNILYVLVQIIKNRANSSKSATPFQRKIKLKKRRANLAKNATPFQGKILEDLKKKGKISEKSAILP